MADLIDITTGAPAMAYVGATPWHKLGHVAPDNATLQEWLVLARANFAVALEPVQRVNQSNLFSKDRTSKILYRTDTGNVLGVVGPRFALTQNSEAVEFFQAFCDANACTMETMGVLDEGRYFWALARMNREWSAGRLKDGTLDKCGDYLLLMLPHQQAKKIRVRYVQMRVVCWNTLSVALREMAHEWTLSHTRKFDAEARAEAQQTMGLAVETAREVEHLVKSLSVLSITDAQLTTYLCKLVGAETLEEKTTIFERDTDNMPRIARRVLESYTNAPGALPGTAWGFVNAVSHFVDHTSFKSDERRARTGLMGTGSALKQAAWDMVQV